LDVSALVAEVTDWSKMGTRDEAYFVAQMLILLFVLVGGGPSKADLGLDDGIFDRLFGVPLLFVAGVLVTRGVADLGDSLTPFPRPRKDNALITSGAYAVVRHPMYAGLIFGAFGLGLLTASPVRILLGVLLAVLLNAKAGKEEGYLEEMHGKEAYAEYADDVPRLAPTAGGVARLLEETFPNVGQTER
jgi:protein-S-isoprenylcysteine O-methyltransferase Ste14